MYLLEPKQLHNARKWNDLNDQQDRAWASRTTSQPSETKKATDDDLNDPTSSVVTDGPDEAITVTETPLAEAVKPADNVPIVAAKPPDTHLDPEATPGTMF
jgi:hypothetical protein